jgi:orotate phosphoribosyltransferase-like protein
VGGVVQTMQAQRQTMAAERGMLSKAGGIVRGNSNVQVDDALNHGRAREVVCPVRQAAMHCRCCCC